MRRALADGGNVPPALRGYAHTIRENAHETKDADVAAILDAGYTEDQVYEMTVSVALGAGMRRLVAGARAVDESFADAPGSAADSTAHPTADPTADPDAESAPSGLGGSDIGSTTSDAGGPDTLGPDTLGLDTLGGSSAEGAGSWAPLDATDPAAPPLARRVPRASSAIAAADLGSGAAR